ncbi:MAG: type II toxin-antitoxin system RelE/ParE family toxin [Vulcanimicrobiaceae bacterium]|jgi:proteic killer suppression protein
MNFSDQGTEDIFNRRNTQAARKAVPQKLWAVAQRKLDQLAAAKGVDELRFPPGNRLELIKFGRFEGYHSIRLNDQYRICFRWTGDDPTEIIIVDYH